MKIQISTCTVILAILLSFQNGIAEEITLKDYKVLSPGQLKERINLFPNGDFEKGKHGWQNTGKPGISIEKGIGRSYTNALVYRRTAPGSYILPGIPLRGLKPGVKYRFGMWIKTHAVQGEGASFCLEWSDRKTGKYISGYYLKNLRGDTDWTKLEQTFVANPDYYYSIALYLRPGTTGTAIFDDAFLYEESGGNWYAGLIMPIQETIDGSDTATLELSSFVVGTFDYKRQQPPIYQALVDIRRDDTSLFHVISPIKNNRIVVHPSVLSTLNL